MNGGLPGKRKQLRVLRAMLQITEEKGDVKSRS